MRLLHFADTHLGYQAYHRLSPEGLNQREVDLQDAFVRVIDWAVRERPDLVVHAGDLFDTVRPSNRAIAAALIQVRRLSEARIPLVLVSGNHEAPRLRETGSIFRIFEGFPYVHPVYRGEYERVRIETREGPVTVHGVPQTLRQSDFADELVRAGPEGTGRHLLVAHGTVAGVDGLFTNELNELCIPANALKPEYDYVALGHFHNHRRLAENAAYSGSTERTSIAEAGEEKVFLEVGLGGGAPKITPHATGARPMRDAGILDAAGADAKTVAAEAGARLEAAAAAPGAILRLQVRGLLNADLRAIDVDAIRRRAQGALHVDLRFEARSDAASIQALPELGSVESEFEAFLSGRPLAGFDRDAVRAVAAEFFHGGPRAP